MLHISTTSVPRPLSALCLQSRLLLQFVARCFRLRYSPACVAVPHPRFYVSPLCMPSALILVIILTVLHPIPPTASPDDFVAVRAIPCLFVVATRAHPCRDAWCPQAARSSTPWAAVDRHVWEPAWLLFTLTACLLASRVRWGEGYSLVAFLGYLSVRGEGGCVQVSCMVIVV